MYLIYQIWNKKFYTLKVVGDAMIVTSPDIPAGPMQMQIRVTFNTGH